MVKTNIDENSAWFNERYWPPDMPKQLEYDPEKTIYDAFVESAENFPHINGFWFLDTWMDYTEMRKNIDDFAGGLAKLGMKKGNLLLDRFDDSIMKIANASIEELKRTDGIGDKLAKSIKETLS